jgi:hypothetical protein
MILGFSGSGNPASWEVGTQEFFTAQNGLVSTTQLSLGSSNPITFGTSDSPPATYPGSSFPPGCSGKLFHADLYFDLEDELTDQDP